MKLIPFMIQCDEILEKRQENLQNEHVEVAWEKNLANGARMLK